MTSLLLLGLAGVGYLGATLRYQKSLYAESEAGDRPKGRRILWLALGLHTAGLVVWGVESGRFPGRFPPETLALLGWMMMALYLVMATALKVEILGAFASPLATFLIIASLATAPWEGTQAPVSHVDWLLTFHVSAILLGYAAFILATGAAVLYLFQTYLLKSKNVKGIFRKMPSLEGLDRATYRLIGLGFPALVIGIALGFVRAQQFGGRFWSFDVLLGLITCGIYAGYIHARMVGGWQGRRINVLLLIGFVFLIATYIGMGIVPMSVHR